MWSSTFRNSGHDSDSDSDVDGDNQPETDQARLMREMDLSARHETVEYRPNPWSIARINAACRPPQREPAPAPAPAKLPPKQQLKPIVEAFKRQASRAVRDVKGVPSADELRATMANSGPPLAHKPRQGCETLRNSAPTRPQPLDVPCPAQKSLTGSLVHVVHSPEKRHPAHISTHLANPPPPLEPRRPFNAHTATRSSPVRPAVVPQRAPDPSNVVRNSKFRHSSPGAPSHAPVSAHTTRPSLPLVSAPTRTTNTPVKVTNHLHVATPPANGQQDQHHGQKMVPRWLLTALHKGLDATPPLPPEPQNYPDPPHIRTPEPKRRRLSPDLAPPPPPKKPRMGAIVSRPGHAPPASPSRTCPSAYTFGDDTDAVWSTTRGTKRGLALANRGKRGGVRQSGRFRLPIAGLTRGTRGMNLPPAKPRVITYMPPPKDLDDGGSAVPTDDLEEKATRTETGAREEEDVEIRVMDSDVTLVNEDGEDVVVDVDVDDVCARYPKTRAHMKAESRVRRVFGCIVEVRV